MEVLENDKRYRYMKGNLKKQQRNANPPKGIEAGYIFKLKPS